MQDASEHFRGSGFKVFARMLEDPKNQVWAIPGPGGAHARFATRMNSWAQGEANPGLVTSCGARAVRVLVRWPTISVRNGRQRFAPRLD